jgi:hypothetical protein
MRYTHTGAGRWIEMDTFTVMYIPSFLKTKRIAGDNQLLRELGDLELTCFSMYGNYAIR